MNDHTITYLYMSSKADRSKLNLPHETKNKNTKSKRN